MPVPRRFDRRPPERDTTRINERIRVPKVRLIGAEGEQLGIVEIAEAMKRAQDADLDLVEVAPGSKPPVTRLLDYSKYKYEQEQKQKAARKHQTQVNVREIKLRPKIADHDYETKKGHVERFLRQRNKVKITIMFRGREQAHPERGRNLLQRLFEDLDGLATIESAPLQEGRNMSMMLAPSKEAMARRCRRTTRPPRQSSTNFRRRRRCHGRFEKYQTFRRRARAAAITSAIRSAAWPSQRGGGSGGAVGTLGERRRDAGYRGRVEAEQGVGAGADRHRALGVVAQGEAGDAEVGRLLLDAAGVGEDGAGVGEQREEVDVAERLGEQQAGMLGRDRLHLLARARVDREDDRHLARQLGQAARPSPAAARRRRGPGGAG